MEIINCINPQVLQLVIFKKYKISIFTENRKVLPL